MNREGHEDEEALLRVTADARIQDASAAAEFLYGFDIGTARGQPLGELVAGESGPLPWPQRLEQASRLGAWTGVELHRAAGGLSRWVSVRVERGASAFEIRARRARGREVLEQRGQLVTMLAEALEVAGMGLWLDDGVSHRIEWSPQARLLYGHAPDEPVTHESFFGCIHSDDRARLAAEIQAIIASEQPRFHLSFRVEDGDRHLETAGRALYHEDGQQLLGIGVVRDVTEHERQAQRIRELQTQLEHLQQVDVTGRLAGGIAHDFNNLLTGMFGYCEMLAMSPLDAQQASAVELLRTAVRRGADLTRQLLAFARRQPLEPKPLVIDTVVASTCKLLRRVVPENVQLDHLSEMGDWYTRADASQIHQVLSNLIINAGHAMPDGGAITVRTRQTVLPRGRGDSSAAALQGDHVVIEVADEGQGIPTGLRQRIFEPFFTTKDEGEGTGLGLTVVRGIVERHGGAIEVTSGDGAGATFTVYLPRCEPQVGLGGTAAAPADGLDGRGRCILLVEDEVMVRVTTRRLLEAEGFEVIEALDGADALERVQRGAEFDLLVTDVLMPRMTGPALVAALRSQRPELPVLYISGYAASFVETRLTSDDSTPLLVKPYTREQLLSALTRLIHHEDATP